MIVLILQWFNEFWITKKKKKRFATSPHKWFNFGPEKCCNYSFNYMLIGPFYPPYSVFFHSLFQSYRFKLKNLNGRTDEKPKGSDCVLRAKE